MAIINVNDQNFEEKVLKSDTPVLVDFFAEWCGPCKMAAPILEKLADEYEGKVKIVKVDVDANQQKASLYGVMSIPTVIMFNKGELVDRQIGFAGEAGYKTMIEKVV